MSGVQEESRSDFLPGDNNSYSIGVFSLSRKPHSLTNSPSAVNFAQIDMDDELKQQEAEKRIKTDSKICGPSDMLPQYESLRPSLGIS